MRVGEIGEIPFALQDHFAADIHPIDFSEDLGQRSRHAPGATADLEHSHLLGVFTLTDIAQVSQDLVINAEAAGLIELLTVPVCIGGSDEMAGVFTGPFVPVMPHFVEYRLIQSACWHLLYCSCFVQKCAT